jgi:hypothetical protein
VSKKNSLRAIGQVDEDSATGEVKPRVQVTRFEGQLAAINDKTLAAYGLAGVRPSNVNKNPFDTLPGDVQARFYEPGVPNFRIPVTRGDRILFHVDAPR